jgi:hypothetical protein
MQGTGQGVGRFAFCSSRGHGLGPLVAGTDQRCIRREPITAIGLDAQCADNLPGGFLQGQSGADQLFCQFGVKLRL